MQYKQLLSAVAALGTVGIAAAQSSVTVFGKLDAGYVNKIGSKTAQGTNGMGEGAQSRIGFRGTEDLGGGLSAFFWLEHRLRSNTGESTAVRFWQGQSIVGLKGGWGSLSFGRDYIAGYVEVQMTPDPFIHTGVSSMVAFGNGNIGTVRNDGAMTYKFDAGDFGMQAQIANASHPNSTTLPAPATARRPKGLSLTYRAGPVYLGYGYEDPGGRHDHWHFATARTEVGPVTLAGGYGRGRTDTLEQRRSWIVGAYLPIASGRLKLVYGDLENTSGKQTISRKYALGYNHHLSKRSFLYANIARDTEAWADRTGVDIGLQHNF
ncbi:porin [Pseudorhodoferax sp. LjRoot39]|uniref:porin n=1 Tax=Pseudorhodoferax sp. LjRoot39 TaxID=3342328 RepID=UPI003ECEF845